MRNFGWPLAHLFVPRRDFENRFPMMAQLSRTPSQTRYPSSSSAIPFAVGTGSSTVATSYHSAARPISGFYSNMDGSEQASASVSAYDQYAVAPLSLPSAGLSLDEPVGPTPSSSGLPTQHRSSSGAWTPQDDTTLLQARAQGQNWNQIQANYFLNKSGNACRKRHERLMERRGADDWDQRKLEMLSKEYMTMRKEIWQPLAQRCGEKWNVVEQKCMSNGLKNIQTHARACARKKRLASNQTGGYDDDDSGVSGIDLPVDDMDTGYNSPESTPSSAGASGHHPHLHHIHRPPSHQDSPTCRLPRSYKHAAFGNYVYAASGGSAPPRRGFATGSAGGYGGAPSTSPVPAQSASPYLDHGGNRLPSFGDKGIDHILHRGAPGQESAATS